MNGRESDRVQVAYLFAPEFDCGTIVGLRSFLLAEEGPEVEIAIPSNPPNARLKLTRLVVPYNCTNATVRQPKYKNSRASYQHCKSIMWRWEENA